MLEKRPLAISASFGLTFDSTISRVECQSEESKATSQSSVSTVGGLPLFKEMILICCCLGQNDSTIGCLHCDKREPSRA